MDNLRNWHSLRISKFQCPGFPQPTNIKEWKRLDVLMSRPLPSLQEKNDVPPPVSSCHRLKGRIETKDFFTLNHSDKIRIVDFPMPQPFQIDSKLNGKIENSPIPRPPIFTVTKPSWSTPHKCNLTQQNWTDWTWTKPIELKTQQKNKSNFRVRDTNVSTFMANTKHKGKILVDSPLPTTRMVSKQNCKLRTWLTTMKNHQSQTAHMRHMDKINSWHHLFRGTAELRTPSTQHSPHAAKTKTNSGVKESNCDKAWQNDKEIFSFLFFYLEHVQKHWKLSVMNMLDSWFGVAMTSRPSHGPQRHTITRDRESVGVQVLRVGHCGTTKFHRINATLNTTEYRKTT